MMRAMWLGLVLSGCVCGPGQLLCGSTCSDLENDAANCGACGMRCVGTCTDRRCDPIGTCRTDSDCNDGLACNGSERCMITSTGMAQCVPGSAIGCADRIPCTADVCEEPGRCTSVPDDLRCPDGICTARGCETCSELPCRLADPQCGCHDGDACYPDLTGGVACEPAGTAGFLDPCALPSDCAPGLSCMSTGAGSSICVHVCRSEADCGARERCLSDGAVATSPVPYGICSTACDLVGQTGCRAGLECVLVDDPTDATLWTACGAIAPLAAGASCTRSSDCRGGLCVLRVAGATSGFCEEWCETARDCPSGYRCGAFAEPIVVAGRSMGSCRR